MLRVDASRANESQRRSRFEKQEQADRLGRGVFARGEKALSARRKDSARYQGHVSRNPKEKLKAFLFCVAIQHAECNCADTKRDPKRDAAISKRDDDCLTPRHTQGSKRERHDAFDDADA